MKKKSIFLLASVAMSAALVGGTFASWAVTDNADPFSIKVSTGNVTTDGTQYVTLEWGASQKMGNVSNLELGTVRKAGVLDLRANTNSQDDPDGTLSFEISGGEHIAAKLHVDVYKTELEADSDGVISQATIDAAVAAGKKLSFSDGKVVVPVVKNDNANIFTVAVYLDSATTGEQYDAMNGEQAFVEFDWGKGTDVLDKATYYATGFAGTPYAYAWSTSQAGTQENAKFPGVRMTEVAKGSGVYSVEIPTTFKNVIFSYDDDYDDETNRQQSGDIVIASAFSGYNLFRYTGTGEGAKGTFDNFDPADVKVPTYYLVGTFNEWAQLDQYKMNAVAATDDEYEITLELAAGAKLKVVESLSNTWYDDESTWDNCGFTLDDEHNIVVTAAGNYKVHLDLTPGGAGNYIDISVVA